MSKSMGFCIFFVRVGHAVKAAYEKDYTLTILGGL